MSRSTLYRNENAGSEINPYCPRIRTTRRRVCPASLYFLFDHLYYFTSLLRPKRNPKVVSGRAACNAVYCPVLYIAYFGCADESRPILPVCQFLLLQYYKAGRIRRILVLYTFVVSALGLNNPHIVSLCPAQRDVLPKQSQIDFRLRRRHFFVLVK